MVRKINNKVNNKVNNKEMFYWKDYRTFKSELDQADFSGITSAIKSARFIKRKKRNVIDILSKLKEAEYSIKESYLSKLIVEDRYNKILSTNIFPKSIKDLEISSKLILNSTGNINNEIEWNLIFFKKYKHELNKFVELKQTYERYILLGKFALAKETLDYIQEKFGFSLWLIENNINLLQLTNGIRSQKEYYDEIFKENSENGFSNLYIDFISILNEENLTMEMFDQRIIEVKSQVPESFYYYLLFKIKYFDNVVLEKDEIIFCTWIDNFFSLIDKYNSVISILHILDEVESIDIYNSFEYFINDQRIVKLIQNNKIENIIYDIKYDKILSIFDLYEKGLYYQVIDLISNILKENPECCILYEIFVISHIRVGKIIEKQDDGLLYQILYNLFIVLQYNDKKNESEDKLNKICSIYNKSSWSQRVYTLVKQNESKIILGKESFRALNYYSEFFNPRKMTTYKNSVNLIKTLNNLYNNHLVLNIVSAYLTNNIEDILNLNIPNERKDRYNIEILFNSKKYKMVISCFEEKHNDYDEYFLNQMSELYINSLVNVGENESALKFSVELFLKNKNYLVKIPLQKLLEIISENLVHKNLIEIPILHSINYELINNDSIRDVSYSFQDFLMENKISLPSEIENSEIIDEFNKKFLVFFLKNVCIQDILEDYVEIETYEDNRNERIKICELLIKIDSENSKDYINEIFSLTQEKLINEGMKRIDESRLNVDIESIKTSLNKKILPLFERYNSLSYTDNVDREYFTLYINDEGIPLQMTENSKKNIFHSIISQIVYMFGFDSRYGLDVSLSTKIRHGFIVGNIREIFVKKNLITKKDSNDTYVDNVYWCNKYRNVLGKKIEEFSNLLNGFSKEIDIKLMCLKNNLLRIRMEGTNKEGLFDFTFTVDELDEIEANVINTSNLPLFLDKIIDELWKKTERDLVIIREKFSGQILQEFHKCFDILIAKITEIESASDSDLSEIRSILNETKVSLQNEFLIISNWFNKPQDSIMPDYEISYVCDIALEFLKKTFSNIDVVKTEIEAIKLSGHTFKSIFFILYNILHNALKYGDKKEKSCFKIYLTKKLLTFEVFNISKEENLEEIRNKITTILKNIENEIYDNVTSEGCTGFYKINNIIRNEMRLIPEITINIDDDFRYSSKICFEIGELIK